MKKLLSLLFTFCFFANASCASPLFHLVVAEKWLASFENYDEVQTRAFLLGTLFPDIRYLGKIDRKLTHESGLSIAEIRQTESPFRKGMRVHTFVDDVRVKFIKNQEIMKHLDKIKGDKILFLKFLEDEIVYYMHEENRSLYICNFLNYIEPEELTFNVSSEIVQDWHTHNIFYFSQAPSEGFALLLSEDRTFGGMQKKTTEDCLNFILHYRDDELLKKYVNAMLEEFDNVLISAKENG